MAGNPKKRADFAALDSLTTGDWDYILDQVANRSSLSDIATHFRVSRRSLTDWIEADDERHAAYKRARIGAAGLLAEQVIEYADSSTPETAAADKLKIQARQWLASRWDRDTYGESKAPQVQINLATLHLDALRQRSATLNSGTVRHSGTDNTPKQLPAPQDVVVEQ